MQRSEPVEPADGEIRTAASMLDWGNVDDSPYFEAINSYDGTDISDTLILIDHFQTCQQTSECGCGTACVLMTESEKNQQYVAVKKIKVSVHRLRMEPTFCIKKCTNS